MNRPGFPGGSIPWKEDGVMEKKATSKRYPPELKERAVRMVQDLRQQDPGDKAVISRVARQLGVGDESLRTWVKQCRDRCRQAAGADAPRSRPSSSGCARRTSSCGAPTTSCRPQRLSSGRSSTAEERSSRLHRRPSGPNDRWASMGGRADLRRARRSPPPPTTTPSPGHRRPGPSVTPSSGPSWSTCGSTTTRSTAGAS